MPSRCLFAVLVVALIPVAVQAGGPPCPPTDHTHQRAGYPQCIACYAIPGRTPKYALGYVGGSCLGWKGEPRCPGEGILGWDYVGCGWYPGRVFLNWCHCLKQPPAGPYTTDAGPHIPDIFAIHPLRRLAESKHEHGGSH